MDNQYIIAALEQSIKQNNSLEITECREIPDIDSRSDYIKLDSIDSSLTNLNSAFGQVPQLLAIDTLSSAYICRFPEGITGKLTELQQGGFGSMIRGSNGKYVGSASFIPVASTEVILLKTFSLMSFATGKYFLTKIDKDLKALRGGIDDVLDFLYGDKKAELISEANFLKYAYENYVSIMEHESQRIATLAGIQSARKTATQDIEFYINDLTKLSDKDSKDVEKYIERAEQIRNSLDFSLQTYVFASVMEIYYAQNSDKAYLTYCENDINQYIKRCENKINSCYSIIKGRISGKNNNKIIKLGSSSQSSSEMQSINTILQAYEEGNDSKLKLIVSDTLNAITKPSEYYISSKSEIYLKAK